MKNVFTNQKKLIKRSRLQWIKLIKYMWCGELSALFAAAHLNLMNGPNKLRTVALTAHEVRHYTSVKCKRSRRNKI